MTLFNKSSVDGKLRIGDIPLPDLPIIPPIPAALPTLTFTPPAVPDYAIQDLMHGGYGFKTLDEAQSVLAAIANLQTRLSAVEERLRVMGIP